MERSLEGPHVTWEEVDTLHSAEAETKWHHRHHPHHRGEERGFRANSKTSSSEPSEVVSALRNIWGEELTGSLPRAAIKTYCRLGSFKRQKSFW